MDENSYLSRINWDTWLSEIRDIGKTNGLVNFSVNEFGQIDIDRAHPGGVAQFTSTGTALLSNMVREPLAFSKALTTARRIKSKSVSHLKNYGIHTTYLVGGMASLEKDGFDLNLPLILWPLELIRKTDDFELKRTGNAFVNPALVAAMFDTYGVQIESGKLLPLLEGASDLLPLAVIEHISSLLDAGAGVEFRRGLVIGNFAIEPTLMELDIRPEGNLLLRQLAEVAEIPEISAEPLSDPRLVADADATQKRIVARALRGDSFAVETLPGTGYTQTVVNLLAALVHDGKRVLVVTPRRQTINELSERLATLKLNGLLVRSSNVWMDVIGSISRYEKSLPVDLVESGVNRDAAATNLENYLESLKLKNVAIDHSLLEVLDSLAKLSAMPNPPETTARIGIDALQHFRSRSEALELLIACESAGLFQHGPNDSAWFGSKFETEEQVIEMMALSKELHESALPALDRQLAALVVESNFRSAKSFEEYGTYLKLWAGVAASLDRFVPEVFDRDITELIEATGPRKYGGGASGSTRRRLKKLAKEFLRTGMSVSDLNQALKDIKEQRDLWMLLSNDGNAPQSISGFSDANVAYRNAVADLSRIQAHLSESMSETFFEQPVSVFLEAITSLATQSGPLENLQERNRLREQLKAVGLETVYEDFAQLHISAEQLPANFDLVWWQSAFELLLELEPDLASNSSKQVSELEQRFIAADTEHIQLGVAAFNQLQAHHWQETIQSNAAEGESLRELLRSRTATFRDLFTSSEKLSSILLGAVAASPYEVAAALPNKYSFDAVLVLDAAGSTIGENLSALMRSEQVIAFGDSAIAAATGFELEPSNQPMAPEEVGDSIFDQVARIFGVEAMRKSWRPTGQTLGAFINREFYQNRIVFEPTASDYAGRSNFDLVSVKAQPATDADLKAESPDLEVSETVAAVMSHARRHPEDSLMVVSASQVHAERIRGELNAKMLEHAELKQFFDSHGDERFEVNTLSELSHVVADRVIFAPGFGILSRGMAANELGQLSLPSGRRTLANMLVSARKSLTLVTSITPENLPAEPVGAVKQFAKMFRFLTPPNYSGESVDVDPMLADLALRLRKLGAHVTLGFTPRVSMAVSYGANSAVIVPDWSLVGDDLSEKIRLRPALLEAMGWQTIRVHALEVFADPQTLAIRIADRLGMRVSVREQSLFDEPSFEETDAGWGESGGSNDQRLLGDKPPHWS